MKSIFKFSLARSWNKEREISDRDQLLSMRFTTNAEAAKGKLSVTCHHIYFSYQKDISIYISNNYSHSYFKASGIPGGNDESTSILIDKALEHQSSLHVRYNDFISLCLQGL